MSEVKQSTRISDLEIDTPKKQYKVGEDAAIDLKVKFSITGGIRDNFNEKNWTMAYNKNDNVFKLKYGIRVLEGGFRKREVILPFNSYKKASIFWTRNPKLAQTAQRKIWIQVSKNFEPVIRLTEDEIRNELFDFEEKIRIDPTKLGVGKHKLSSEVHVSWMKHYYTEPFNDKATSNQLEVEVIN